MRILLSCGVLFVCCASFLGLHSSPDAYPITSVSFSNVQVNDTFWKPRLEKNRAITIPHLFGELHTHGTIENFAIAAKLTSGTQKGAYPFNDSDLFKTIEAVSYDLQKHPNPKMASFVDSLVTIIEKAQEPDGYLYTARTNNAALIRNWANNERWKGEERSHELYNAGHLYEAAVAYFKATSKRNLLDIALKNAELVLANFGKDKIAMPPGHQEIELALPKLYEVTKSRKYLDAAQYFLDARGDFVQQTGNTRKSYGEYAQDHKPISEQDEAVGHAVRTGYMCSSLLDVSAFTNDPKYAESSRRLWQNVVSKKLYITGGIGQTGQNEGFAGNYDLPNMSAYQETCSSISNIMWNHRLFLTYGDAQYLDIMERTLYNAFLSGVGLSGDRFFYDNPLASNGQHERTSWFDCACCPPNVARFLARFPELIYATRNNEVFVNLFVGSSANISLPNSTIQLKQETQFPWNGRIRLTIEQGAFEGAINVRIPSWAKNEVVPSNLYKFDDVLRQFPSLKINGRKPSGIVYDKGFAKINRKWKRGDVIEVDLPMPVRRISANAEVVQNRNKVAFQRGALVYALEGVDNQNGEVHNVAISPNVLLQIENRPNVLGGITVVKTNAEATRLETGQLKTLTRPVTLIPYHLWSNRGRSDMAVWIPTKPEITLPLGAPSVAEQSQISASGGENATWVKDQKTDAAFVWQKSAENPNKAWLEYQFGQVREVSQVEVFWFTKENEVAAPKSWRISANVNGKWSPVWNPSKYWGLETGRFNRTYFETVRTDAIRLEVDLPESQTSGVLEWRVR